MNVDSEDLAVWRSPELILGESHLLPFEFLRQGDRIGRAVVKIQRGDGAAGTGFMVISEILLTNHHVLPDFEVASNSRALANYEVSPSHDYSGRPAVVRLRPDLLFVTNPELDFTFCGVKGLNVLGSVALNRDHLDIYVNDYVNIIQHPRGRPKEVALQENQVVGVDGFVVRYRCDTEPGSSGSPVFNNRWQVVALHHASVPDPPSARSGGQLFTGKFLNEGIRLSAIVDWLNNAEEEERPPELLAQIARLKAGIL
jgi:endonuclease G